MTNDLIEDYSRLSFAANDLRKQLIVLTGGVLTVFVALSESTQTAYLIKLGFLMLGVSLLFGILSIILNLSHSFIEWFFVKSDLFLFESLKSLNDIEKEISVTAKELSNSIKALSALELKHLSSEELSLLTNRLGESKVTSDNFFKKSQLLLATIDGSKLEVLRSQQVLHENEHVFKMLNTIGKNHYLNSVAIVASLLQITFFLSGVFMIIANIYKSLQ